MIETHKCPAFDGREVSLVRLLGVSLEPDIVKLWRTWCPGCSRVVQGLAEIVPSMSPTESYLQQLRAFGAEASPN